MRWYNVHHGFHCAKLVIYTLTKHYLFNEKISWERNTIGRDIGMLITPMYKPKYIIFKARKDCPVETMLPGEFQIWISELKQNFFWKKSGHQQFFGS